MPRYVTQRDPDDGWSVRDSDTGLVAVVGGVRQAGLTEAMASHRCSSLNGKAFMQVTFSKSSNPQWTADRIDAPICGATETSS